MPGHAGNFLARLFSLGNETIPQLPIDYLNYIVSNGLPDRELDRLSLYSFDQVNDQYSTWQDFHRAWGDFHQMISYNLLNVFLKNKQAMVYAIHPHEFHMFQPVIQQLDSVEYYAVQLDSSYRPWVEHNRSKLNFVWRDGELELFDQYKDQYSMQDINLTQILNSESEFLAEYQRVCACMDLNVQLPQAVELYRSWIAVRG